MPTAEALRDEYLAALLARDPTRARFIVDQAVTDGMPVRQVYVEVLAPVLEEVGKRWAAGELTVAHEHYATAVTLGVLGTLAPRIRVPPSSGRLAVVACTPGELHAVGAQMVGDFLEAEGWEVLSLGASTPGADLAALVDDERPDVVALSTAVAGNVDGAEDVLRRLRELDDPPFLAAGGRAWAGVSDDRRREMGADAFFDDPNELTALVRTRFPPIDDDG